MERNQALVELSGTWPKAGRPRPPRSSPQARELAHGLHHPHPRHDESRAAGRKSGAALAELSREELADITQHWFNLVDETYF